MIESRLGECSPPAFLCMDQKSEILITSITMKKTVMKVKSNCSNIIFIGRRVLFRNKMRIFI